MTGQVILILTIILAACGQKPQSDINLLTENKSATNNNFQVYQTYFVNDIILNVEQTKLFKTNIITDPKVVFVEKMFSVNVNRTDLLNVLKFDSQNSGKDFETIYNIVISYIESTDNLTFEYIWTKAEDFDDISLFDIERLGPRNLTKKILKETICGLIEKGDFEIIQSNEKVINYFFERVYSNYGGNVKGVFTTEKRLIWICPPFEVD
jgi:hypothetical protein